MADEPTPPEPPATEASAPSAEPSAPGASGISAPSEPPVTKPDEAPAPPRPEVAELVLQALAAGPATGWEIVQAVEAIEPGLFAGREGYVYPLLVEMRRSGRVVSRWVDRWDGRRRVYGPEGTIWPETSGGTTSASEASGQVPAMDTSGIAPTPAMRRIADAVSERLTFAPLLAEEARAEVLRHILDGAHLRERAGRTRPDAEREAIRALGDPWKISTDLARTARGRRTVIFPRTPGQSALSLAIYDVGILVAILATILFVRFEVVQAYHIPTKSMEPTLHGDRDGGDRILVMRMAPTPKRFDIEVFEGWGTERKQYVKRCVGLPGEEVSLFEGDLWIDGHLIRKEGAALDALLFRVFDLADSQAAAKRDAKKWEATPPAERESETPPTLAKRLEERWDRSETAGKWLQWPEGAMQVTVGPPPAANDLPATHHDPEPAVLRWKDRLTDSLYDEETADPGDGSYDVGDGRVTLDVRPVDEASRVLVRWTRGAEHFDAVLRGEQKGVALFVDGSEIARAEDVTLPLGEWTRVRFSHVDHVLRLEVNGKLVLRQDFPEPVHPRRIGPSSEVSVRIPNGTVRLLPQRLERDVHWTTEYESLDRPRLGPDEFFMLGDNSGNSQDSRVRGPVHRGRLVGSPLLIVWPLSRFRIPR